MPTTDLTLITMLETIESPSYDLEENHVLVIAYGRSTTELYFVRFDAECVLKKRDVIICSFEINVCSCLCALSLLIVLLFCIGTTFSP